MFALQCHDILIITYVLYLTYLDSGGVQNYMLVSCGGLA